QERREHPFLLFRIPEPFFRLLHPFSSLLFRCQGVRPFRGFCQCFFFGFFLRFFPLSPCSLFLHFFLCCFYFFHIHRSSLCYAPNQASTRNRNIGSAARIQTVYMTAATARTYR